MLLGDSEVGKTSIFDTAGQDRFNSLRGAQGFVCIFDFTKKQSFDNVFKWINQIRETASVPNPTILVLGNKRDLDLKEVTDKDIEQIMEKCKDVIYFETSARNGYQVDESFRSMTVKLVERGKQNQVSGFKIQADSRRTQEILDSQANNSGCCSANGGCCQS
ncbi:ras-related protein rab11 [Stylonychia lemnae]|uniref:Ras-related protein rab11 n=1 Tax=Stylonychia lemnae TaxID=5949 RepID=A0A078A1C0_STYLE|nr:ras-related protein rab11 [Stylonychia lemnae]|eukprot:CDW75642.1 ras-related protein rab11 [Stylonychia lemnae]